MRERMTSLDFMESSNQYGKQLGSTLLVLNSKFFMYYKKTVNAEDKEK
jgi:hypothetical protein